MHSRAHDRTTKNRGVRSDEGEVADTDVVAHIRSGSKNCMPADLCAVLDNDIRRNVATEVESRRVGDQRTRIDNARPTLGGNSQPVQAGMTLRRSLRAGEGRDKQQGGRELPPVTERAKNAILADVLLASGGVIEKSSQSNRLPAFCQPDEGLRNDQAAAATSEHYNRSQPTSPAKECRFVDEADSVVARIDGPKRPPRLLDKGRSLPSRERGPLRGPASAGGRPDCSHLFVRF